MNSPTIIRVRDLDLFYGDQQALKRVNMDIPNTQVTALIGPSGCGKSTLIRCFNRMNDLVDHCRITGVVDFHGKNIYDRETDPVELRRRIGMVFQKPNPFPKSIFENVAYGPRVHGIKDKETLSRIVEQSLKNAALWEEVEDRLHQSAMGLSGGQQQRLCIARALAPHPEIVMLDEPCSGLDPISTAKVEDAMQQLKADYTQILVTNNTKQASRVSERCAFFLMGELVELGPTQQLFTKPKDKRTDDYITGRFG